MSDYTKTTDFTAKDAATATILGSEHDTEFNAIAAAVATKANKVSGATANNLASLTSAGDIQDSGVAQGTWQVLTAGDSVGTSTSKTKALSGTVEAITIAFMGVSTDGTSGEPYFQLGTSSSLTTSGYDADCGEPGATYTGFTNGWHLGNAGALAADTYTGAIEFRHLGNNKWCGMLYVHETNGNTLYLGGGSITLAGAVDIVGIVAPDNFDAGTWRVSYERSA
jgi:hypothetical protein